MKYRRIAFALLFAASLIFSYSPSAAQTSSRPKNKHVVLDWSFDQMTGRAFSSTAKNADTQSYFASVNRLMTAYLVLDRLASGQIKESDLVTISKNAASVRGTSIFLKAGSQVPIATLLKALLNAHAFDATIALAEGIGGSERAFVELMNETAADLGMDLTTFSNASGLPKTGNVSTAHDIAKLAGTLWAKHRDEFNHYYADEFSYKGIKYRNRNLTYEKLDEAFQRSVKKHDVRLLMTAYSDESGREIIAWVYRNGQAAVSTGPMDQAAAANLAARLINAGDQIEEFNSAAKRWAAGRWEPDVTLTQLKTLYNTGQNKNLAIQACKKAYNYDKTATNAYRLARAHMSGNEWTDAWTWAKVAADEGYLPAINLSARLLRYGRGVKANPEAAFELLKSIEAKQFPPSLTQMGQAYLDGTGVVQDIELAHQYFEKAIDLGEPFAMHQLGVSYIMGRGLPKDTNKGVELIKQSAEGGNMQGQRLLAHMHKEGYFVTQDRKQAQHWYSKASEHGDTISMVNFGMMMEDGFTKGAVQVYHRASDRGSYLADYLLGMIYHEGGRGVPRNRQKAIERFQRAAKSPNPDLAKKAEAALKAAKMPTFEEVLIGLAALGLFYGGGELSDEAERNLQRNWAEQDRMMRYHQEQMNTIIDFGSM